MPEQIIECADCGRLFLLGLSEQWWYRDHGLELPKRCKECRARRRHDRERDDAVFIDSSPIDRRACKSFVAGTGQDQTAGAGKRAEKARLAGIGIAIAGVAAWILKKVLDRKGE